MKISVAICTWNRAALLDDTLTSLRAVVVPPDLTWEVIVVNNNSNDDTDGVITRHSAHVPLVRLFEARPGKSYAANLAANAATGDLLVWTDDDVRFHPSWLTEYAAAATTWPDIGYFAGPIEARFEADPPAWITRHLSELAGVYVVVDHGSAARPLNAGDSVFGANMAFRTEIAREFPLNAQLGRIQGSLIGADDTELIARVRAAGFHGRWVPGARIQHFNSAERVTKTYVKKWYRDAGRSLVRQGAVRRSGALGVPPWVLRQYIVEVSKRYFWAADGGSRWFDAFRQSVRLEGAIRELLDQRGRPDGAGRP